MRVGGYLIKEGGQASRCGGSHLQTRKSVDGEPSHIPALINLFMLRR